MGSWEVRATRGAGVSGWQPLNSIYLNCKGGRSSIWISQKVSVGREVLGVLNGETQKTQVMVGLGSSVHDIYQDTAEAGPRHPEVGLSKWII